MSRRSEEARLRKAAEHGDLNAANDLADLLEEDGDRVGAERWYRFAAAADDMEAAADLGRMLWIREAFEEAELWLRRAATSNDPETAQYGAALLGKCLIDLGQPDEAEQWLVIGADAGLDLAAEALERLRKGPANEPTGGPGSGVLQTFEVDSVMFYDGTGHRLGPSVCTLTGTRLIIDDAYGGISQIQLRDINRVSAPGRRVSPKMLRVTAASVAYDIYFLSKDQKYLFEACLSEAIHGL
jgi:tetratricopeptide (TPR) repeat protein